MSDGFHRTLMEILRPAYAGDVEDLDVFANEVSDHLIRNLNGVAADLMTYRRLKVGAFGPRASESETFYEPSRRGSELHYWAEVQYPTSLMVRGKFKVNIAKRWAEAVRAARGSNGVVPPLTPLAMSFFADMLVEALDQHATERLPPEVIELLEDAMAQDPSRGLDTEATMSTVGEDGGEEEHNEAASVDVRFRLTVNRKGVSLTSAVSEGSAVVEIKVPVQVAIKKIVSPFDSGYMRP